MPFFQSPSHRLSRCGQDSAPSDVIEASQLAQHSITQSSSVHHSLPVQGLRYRGDAYHSATVAQATKLSSPHRECQVVKLKVTEYDKAHRLHIQQRLQHRIEVAMAKGDQKLVNLLRQERQAG